MASNDVLPPPGFDELPVEERIDYVHGLWDRIAARPGDVPVPDWHREVVAERLAAYRDSPAEGRTWSEVREALLRKLRASSD